jgi:hypothetical protein
MHRRHRLADPIHATPNRVEQFCQVIGEGAEETANNTAHGNLRG